ncbi:MAG: hypothetical protein KME55_23160 [Nostoc indistinguendum CM1-VF10]|jgi:hypothetical protein|nr:hypothetical protein [Nostoc indistinguendum CM1-VF10]
MGEVSLTMITVYPLPASFLYLGQNPRPHNPLKFDDLRVDAEIIYGLSLQWV